MSPARGTIFLEQARVLSQLAYDGEQFVLRLAAPKCAAHAEPGSFVALTCDSSIPMRRPLSIMRAHAGAGWIELLYKVVGAGLHALAARKTGDELSVLGPIGRPFVPHAGRPRALLLGGGVGIPPMVFLAERLSARNRDAGGIGNVTQWKPLVLMGSEVPFPFRTRPSKIILPAMPAGTLACMPLLEEWGVPCRLASCNDFPGCFAVPCQVSLEEFMACAVGGCAGCTVQVRTPEGPAMKRVCVDGPVFDAYTVF
jgi:dihydroorotate dehydrogenase electron transfer subunit